MPSAWMIGPFVLKSSLVILAISFILSFGLFWYTSTYTKAMKKQLLHQIESLIIMFIFAVFIGKILLNISTFVQDPLAILAYPSNTNTFYIAVLLTVIYVWFTYKKRGAAIQNTLFALIQIILSAAFFYEFIIVIWGNGGQIAYVGLLGVLLVLSILLQEKISAILLLLWSGAQLIISFFDKATIFQYTIDAWFFVPTILLGAYMLVHRSSKFTLSE